MSKNIYKENIVILIISGVVFIFVLKSFLFILKKILVNLVDVDIYEILYEYAGVISVAITWILVEKYCKFFKSINKV